jgi:hypothetical protein
MWQLTAAIANVSLLWLRQPQTNGLLNSPRAWHWQMHTIICRLTTPKAAAAAHAARQGREAAAV